MCSDRFAKGRLYHRLGELLAARRSYFFDTRSNFRSIILQVNHRPFRSIIALSYHISHGCFRRFEIGVRERKTKDCDGT
jgi:hypothetical protein